MELLPSIDLRHGRVVRLHQGDFARETVYGEDPVAVARAGVDRALYAGDDTTDVDAFRGLDGLAVAVRVAVDSGEAPPALLAAADLVVEGTEGVLALLRAL